MKKQARYAAPALDKGLDILEHLSASGVPRSQTQIAKAIGRKPAEIFRMIACLESRGYVLRDPASGNYQLSLKLYHLSHVHSPVESLRRAAARPLQELADETGHAAHICVLDRDSVLVIMQVRSPNPVSISIEEGSRFPLELTTSGRLLLACSAAGDRDALLERSKVFQNWKKPERVRFLESLEPIARDRHQVAVSDLTQGVSDVAALVGSPGGPFMATIAVSCMSSVLGRSANPDKLLKATLATASRINQLIGTES